MYRAHGITAHLPGDPSPTTTHTQGPQYTTRGLSTRTRIEIYRLLQLGWERKEIASRVGVSATAVYHVAKNL